MLQAHLHLPRPALKLGICLRGTGSSEWSVTVRKQGWGRGALPAGSAGGESSSDAALGRRLRAAGPAPLHPASSTRRAASANAASANAGASVTCSRLRIASRHREKPTRQHRPPPHRCALCHWRKCLKICTGSSSPPRDGHDFRLQRSYQIS